MFSVVISCASCICQSRCILPSEFAWFDFKFTNYDISVSWSCSSINYPSHWNKGNKHNFSSSRRGKCLHKSIDIPNKFISRVAQKLLLIAWYIIFSTLFLYKTLHQILQQHAITKTQSVQITQHANKIKHTRHAHEHTHNAHIHISLQHINFLIILIEISRAMPDLRDQLVDGLTCSANQKMGMGLFHALRTTIHIVSLATRKTSGTYALRNCNYGCNKKYEKKNIGEVLGHVEKGCKQKWSPL